jgi:autotransporter-associated beta strand protein
VNPTTANLILNTVTGAVSFAHTLALGGSATGSSITGVAADSVSGTLAILKQGAGTWTLQGANTYSGGTSVTVGTLMVNNASGSGLGKGNVGVAGGVLGGTGTIGFSTDAANVTLTGGHLAPGASGSGTLTVNGNVALNASSSLDINIANVSSNEMLTTNSVTGSGGGDSANGDVTLGGATLNLTLGFTPVAGDIGHTYTIINNNSVDPVSGQFASGSFVEAGVDDFAINYAGGTGNNDVVLTLNALPEPSSLGLLGVAGLGLLARKRRRVAQFGK